MTKELISFKPNYDGKCVACGSSPTVTGLDEDGKKLFGDQLCGPCFFGEAEAVDPETW
jgi:hypothetical protein